MANFDITGLFYLGVNRGALFVGSALATYFGKGMASSAT
jgi:hypothetical protein